MTPDERPIVILGGGPAGMSAAWRLSELGHRVVLLEADSAVGGMAKTIGVGPYHVDFGPHTFHVRETDESRSIRQAIQSLFGPDPLVLTRGTRILLRGKEYVYPVEMSQLLTGVNPTLAARIIFDYAVATIRSAWSHPTSADSFEEWGVRNLGRTLYDLCFGIYSARVWGLPTSQISSKQAQRVAKLNLKNIILRALGIKADPTTYFAKYMYPREGISVLFENMADAIRAHDGTILLNARASALEVENGRVARVRYTREGKEEVIECAGVLSTLPLPALVKMISPAVSRETSEQAGKLRYRSLKLIYIALKRSRLTDYHWVYLLDEKYRVNRVSEQKNVSPSMVPDDRTILCIELSLWRDEDLWNASDEELYKLALRDLMEMGYGVTEEEVDSYYVADIPTAYPVYELSFEDHLIAVLTAVHSFENLLTLGRHGLFLNNSMDDNVLLGMNVGDHIQANGFRSDMWLEKMLAFMNLRFEGK